MTQASPWGKGLGFRPRSLTGGTRNEFRGDEALFTQIQGAALHPEPPRPLSNAPLGEHLSSEDQLYFKRPHGFPGASLAYSPTSIKRFPMTNVSPEPKIEPRHQTRGDPEHAASSPPPLGAAFRAPRASKQAS